jgi:hypothetical protein
MVLPNNDTTLEGLPDGSHALKRGVQQELKLSNTKKMTAPSLKNFYSLLPSWLYKWQYHW